MLQHDNALPHIARVVRDFLAQKNIDVLPWPAISLYLAPIEHVWSEMQRRVRALPEQLVALVVFGQTLVKIRNGIPQAFFNDVVDCIYVNGSAIDFLTHVFHSQYQ